MDFSNNEEHYIGDSTEYDNEILKNIEIIKGLSETDSDYPKVKETLNSLVKKVVENDYYHTFQLLLDNGYKLEVMNEEGQSALHYAFVNYSCDVIEEYFLRQPFPNDSPDWADSNGLTHLHIACAEDPWEKVSEIVKNYLKNGSDINARYHSDPKNSNRGSTPLHFAMKRQNLAVVMILLENEADINAANAKGITPFHLVCQSTNELIVEKIELFINRFDADLEAKDKHGDTPLLMVFDDYYGKLYCFEIIEAKQKFDTLISNGANILAKNNNGDTLLHLIIKTLKIYHSDLYPEYDNLFDDTGHAELVEQILSSNKELLEMKNNKEQTPC